MASDNQLAPAQRARVALAGLAEALLLLTAWSFFCRATLALLANAVVLGSSLSSFLALLRASALLQPRQRSHSSGCVLPAACKAAPELAAPAAAVCRSRSRLPPQLPEHRGRLTVCLDLDETLVCTYRLAPSSGQRPQPLGGASSRLRRLSLASLFSGSSSSSNSGRGGATAGGAGACTVSLCNPEDALGASAWLTYHAPGPGPGPASSVALFLRPGLREFLACLRALPAELVLFTAASAAYSEPIVRLLDPDGSTFAAVLYGDATVTVCGRPGVKDLCLLGRELRRTVLVDNSPYSFLLQPSCGLPVLPFHGDRADGQLLGVVAPLLASLSTLHDVRPALRCFRIRAWLASRGCQLPGEESEGDE